MGSEAILPTSGLPPRTAATLVVQAGHSGLGFVRLWPAAQPRTEFRLPPATFVRGKLLLPNGEPAAGIRARPNLLVRATTRPVEFVRVDTIKELRMESVSQDDGTFSLSSLPPNVTVAYDVVDDRFAQLRMSSRATTPVAGVGTAKPVKLVPAATISGRVTRDGKPVAGFRVGSQGNHEKDMDNSDIGGFGVTDKDGRYTMRRLPAGFYNVILDTNGQEHRGLTAAAHEGLHVREGHSVSGIDFKMTPGVLVQGTVVGPAGKPVSGTSVGVYGPAHPRSSAWVQTSMTDKLGKFALRVPPGEQYVYVADSRYNSDPKTITVADGGNAWIEFQVSAAPLEEDVTEGSPAAEVEVREQDPAELGPVPPVASFGPGKPFYGPAKLANGAVVRLAYVQEDSTGPRSLWKPDGSTALAADVGRSLNMASFANGRRNPRPVFLRVDIEGVERGTYNCVVEVPHASSWNVWQTYGDSEDRSMDMASFRAPESLKVTDMRFGVAAGPAKAIPLSFSNASKGLRAALTETTVTVAIQASLEGKDVQMAAFDGSGREIQLSSYETETRKNGVRSFTFERGDIARAELRVRDYQWATFKGIHLYPRGR